MIIGIPKEITDGETRVALSPESAGRLIQKQGHSLLLESGAGVAAAFPDSDYTELGVKIEKDAASLYAKADLIVKVQKPGQYSSGKEELTLMRSGGLLVGFFWSLNFPELAQKAAKQGLSVLAMDAVPRITRAQRMDALSSQTNLAGYKAALLAAHHLNKIFPMLMTAAGTITPAKVVILGAGVAGLQAIATARRLGAVVEVSDVRPSVKEQVESLGGRYIEPPREGDSAEGEGEGGYAKEVSKEFLAKQKELLEKHIAQADAVITTALVPGKRAPVLVSRAMVESMRPGAVIVDMAAEQGGNCELCQAGKNVEHKGVQIIGALNLPAALPYHASQLYSRNITALIEYITNKDAGIELDPTDEIVKACLIVHKGEVVHEKTKELLAS